MCTMDNNIDLFLVDIILEPKVRNDSSGIKFAKDVREMTRYKWKPIIFITTLSGLEAHLLKQVHCYDYIEKPIDTTRVRKHILEALDAILSERREKEPESLMLRYEGISFPITVDRVIYVVNRRGILYIHDWEEVIEIPNLSTKSFLERVKDNTFLEPKKGTAVNTRYIKSVDFGQNKVYLRKTEDVIPIGGRLKKKFREEFEECFGSTN